MATSNKGVGEVLVACQLIRGMLWLPGVVQHLDQRLWPSCRRTVCCNLIDQVVHVFDDDFGVFRVHDNVWRHMSLLPKDFRDLLLVAQSTDGQGLQRRKEAKIRDQRLEAANQVIGVP